MNELAGFMVYAVAVWAALTLFDELQNRRRAESYRARAARLRHMRGTP